MSPDRPLRVCIAVGPYPPQYSGHGIQMQRTLPFLRARGIEPTILAYRLWRGTVAPEEDPRTVHRVLSLGRGVASRLARIIQFRRYFARRRREIDVLHCALVGWEFILNIPYLKRLGLPILIETVLLDGDDPLTISRERFGGFKIGRLRRVEAWVGIAGAFLPRAQAVGIDEDRCRLIYTGVDVQQYRPATTDERRVIRERLGVPTHARVAVSVGSVIRRKGIDRVLKAWKRMGPIRGKDLLLIVGPMDKVYGLPGPDPEFVQSMVRETEESALQGTARLVGRSDRVEDYLRAADLFVLLSRREGLGTVILEAMACGLPCIVSPLDGIASEVVTHGRTGFIIDNPEDPGIVAQRMSRLLNDAGLRAAMGSESRQEALLRFSLDARADALVSLYKELATSRHLELSR